jgi:RND family efflux transporter MFP subunit
MNKHINMKGLLSATPLIYLKLQPHTNPMYWLVILKLPGTFKELAYLLRQCQSQESSPRFPVLRCTLYGLLAQVLMAFTATALADDPMVIRIRPLSEVVIYPESSAPAVAVSLNDTPIAAQVDAQIANIKVRVGDTVVSGTILATLDCREFIADRIRLRGELHAIEARIQQARWHLQQSQVLASQHTLPEERVRDRQAQLGEQQGNIEAQRGRLQSAERQIGQCTLKAPFTALVSQRLASVGQFVTRGTAIVRLVDLSQREVSAQIPVADTPGFNAADALAFDYQGRRYPLRLRHLLPTIASDTRTQEARLEFSENIPPAGAAGRLVWASKQPHLPADLLIKLNNQLGIFLETGGKATFHPLPQAQAGTPADIDLPSESRIIVSGQFGLKEGTAVKVVALEGN